MTRSHRWVGQTVGAAALAAGLFVTGCGARSGGDGNANSTVNLSSLPAAEAWVDGKPAGSTPLAVPLAPGKHELVLKQAGFTEHRQTLDVAAGAVASVDATLQPLDPMDPDALRLVAAAYGVTVEPFRAPEVHRGAASIGGVALLYPRNDVRKEGLSGYRVDVTPAYEGGGWLEFRKGKTSLHRQKFEPDTLVSASSLPAAVLDAVKTGDTITWGIYFPDARKPITAQFEIVAKPTATKKLAELQGDRRLAMQPVALRQQLEAEVLQNYRLYSEALVRLLDIHAADKDSTVPYGGIVSCLRRLDLEDTALFTEAASKAVGLASRRRGAEAAGMPAKRTPTGAPSSNLAPPADATPAAPSSSATPAAPAAPAPAPADATATGPMAPASRPNPAVPPAPPVGPGAPPSGPGVTPPDATRPDDPAAIKPPVPTPTSKAGPRTEPENAPAAQPPTPSPVPANSPNAPAAKTPATPPSGNVPTAPATKSPATPPSGNAPTPPPTAPAEPPVAPPGDVPVPEHGPGPAQPEPTTPPAPEHGPGPAQPEPTTPPAPERGPGPAQPEPTAPPAPERGPGPDQPEPSPAPAQPEPIAPPTK